MLSVGAYRNQEPNYFSISFHYRIFLNSDPTICLDFISGPEFIKLFLCSILKTCLYYADPLKPHFYIVKLGFTGVCIIFLISAQKHRLWVLVRTASARRFYRVPTIYVLSRNMKNIRMFYLKNCHFFGVKFSVYLNRHVFVMQLS